MIKYSDINIVPLSSVLQPLEDIKSNYNTLDINYHNINFYNGINLTYAPVFSNIRDVKINNNSVLLLSKHIPVDHIFRESINTPPNLKTLIKHSALKLQYLDSPIETTSISRNNNNISSSTIVHQEAAHKYKFINTEENKFTFINDPVFNKKQIFKFNFHDDYVTISNLDNIYFTDRDTYMYLSEFNNSNNQKFKYILNDVGIILFKYSSNFTEAVTFNIDNNSIYYTDITIEDNIPNNCIIYIETLKDLFIQKKSIENSFIAKYITNNLSALNSLEFDLNIKHNPYPQEYIVNIPYTGNNTIYINSLKNYQTPEYEYSLVDNTSLKREYTNIFAGTSQQKGYDNLYLNYKSIFIEKKLLNDTNTIFHYPATAAAEGTSLSAAGLIESGAIAGKLPYTSDRISYNQRDYRELNIETQNDEIADNTWLYSWLSAGDDGSCKWMDRYYRGAYITAATQDYIYYTVNDPLVVDVPSTIKLMPNRIYSYFHQGQNNIKKYVSELDNIDNTTILKIDNWSSISLTDSSYYNNNGIISLNTQTLSAEQLYLDGRSYALFPASPSLGETRHLSLGFWLNVEDWQNIEGYQIVGNYSNAGVGLFNKQIIPTSLFTLYDNINNHIYNYNTNFKLISEQNTDKNKKLNIENRTYIQRTVDQNYWLISEEYLTATKYNLNNNKIIQIDLSTSIKNIDQVEIDEEEYIYVVDSVHKILLIFNSINGDIITSENPQTPGISIPIEFNRIEILKNYNNNYIFKNKTSYAVGVYGDNSTSDSYNNIWTIIGINLYKNNKFYASIGKCIQITCDSYNNIWIIHDVDKVTKINTDTESVEFTKTFNSNILQKLPKQSRYINFINLKIDNKEETLALIIDNQEKTGYIVRQTGELYLKISLLLIPSTYLANNNFNQSNIHFTALGDFTGYQYLRKFANKSELEWRVGVTDSYNPNSSNTKIIRIPFDVSLFDSGWHYFNFVFSYTEGSISIYIDSKLIKINFFDEKTPQPLRYFINSSAKPFCVGAVTTEQGVLNDTIGINDKYKFKGYISNLHLYKYSFDKYDINALYNSTFYNMYKPLIWNIKVGPRNYIEQVDKFFINNMPGSKSKFFNIVVRNFNCKKEQKDIIEQSIRRAISRIAPADTTLLDIKWE